MSPSSSNRKRKRRSKRMDKLPLTPREIDVLRLLARGCTYTQIAGRLGVSLHTVASHVKHLYRKLDGHPEPAAVWPAFQPRVLLHPDDAYSRPARDCQSRVAPSR